MILVKLLSNFMIRFQMIRFSQYIRKNKKTDVIWRNFDFAKFL